MAGFADPGASAVAAFYFLVAPACAAAIPLVVAFLAWRKLTSQPLNTPPRVRGSTTWQFYVVLALDPLVFGFILWILWTPVIADLQAGGGQIAIESGDLLLTLAGGGFALASLAVALSQSSVFWRRARDLLGPSSPRVFALLALPVFCAISALVAGILILHFAESLLASPTLLIGNETDPWLHSALVSDLMPIAVIGSFTFASQKDPGTRSGFLRALACAAIAIVVPLLSMLVFVALAIGA